MLTVMLLISMLLRHLNLAVGYTLYSVGYERHLAMTALADGVLTLLLMWPCISLFGAKGAALASIVGVVLVSLPSNVRALIREAEVSTIGALRPTAAWGLRCCLSGAAIVTIVTFTPPTGLWIVPAAIAIAGLYVVSMWPLLTMPPFGPRLAQALNTKYGASADDTVRQTDQAVDSRRMSTPLVSAAVLSHNRRLCSNKRS